MNNSASAKPRLSFLQIWNMSFGFLGIQFGFAIQNGNTSRIYETLGANESQLPILWLAAPMTGLLVQPIIGYFSDRTWHPKFGRRRPYFTVGAVLASIALCLMPNSTSLWMAAGMLWILDASINISMEPFRAFVADMLPPDQRTRGFAMQSFFIGVGAVVGSYLPRIYTSVFDFDNTAPKGEIPDNVTASYYTGALIFLSAVLWTVFTTREYPPSTAHEHKEEKKINSVNPSLAPGFFKQGLLFMSLGVILTLWFYFSGLEKELYIVAGILALFGGCYLLAAQFIKRGDSDSGFVTMVTDFRQMPRTMRQLTVVQFFTWFSLFSMWIYTTPTVTRYFFNSSDPTSQAYNDGADWVNELFAWYNGVAAAVAFLLPVLARYTSRKITHMICLFLGGIGLMSFNFLQDPDFLILSMICVGIAWSSILSMPYAMLSSSLPPDKVGYYMGIFNIFIVIPQIIAASVLGFLVRHFFHGETIYAFVAGGLAFLLAAILTLTVEDKDETATSHLAP
jgi:maltose/moltooligosaccharide transporter